MFTTFAVVSAAILAAIPADPGPRPGQPGAPAPLPGLTSGQLAAFQAGLLKFSAPDGVGEGLGPRFNLDSCRGCHAQPVTGGSSPSVNPQIAAAAFQGAHNQVPAFISQNGPVRVARIRRNPDGSRNGGVQALFTVEGRSDAPGCVAPQYDFTRDIAANNLTFRIPTPVLGAGLMEAIPDSAILANQAQNGALKNQLGIAGRPNRSGNDGTITRFGWKAQNKSLLLFAGEAYNVEEGVTNELFPNERDLDARGCGSKSFEDGGDFDTASADSVGDIGLFSVFMRFSAPPPPAPGTASIGNGRGLFASIGCALCHTPSFTTGPSATAALDHEPVNLYSDLLLHHMGPQLADDVVQGDAAGDEFRTAPLWGLGQRLFFLHDGRTADLLEAIRMHRGPLQAGPPGRNNGAPPSEANAVIDAFEGLQPQQKQDLLNFLRSL